MKHLLLVLVLTLTASAVDGAKIQKLNNKAIYYESRAIKAFENRKFFKCYSEINNALNAVYLMGIEAIGDERYEEPIFIKEKNYNEIKDICEKLGGF